MKKGSIWATLLSTIMTAVYLVLKVVTEQEDD